MLVDGEMVQSLVRATPEALAGTIETDAAQVGFRSLFDPQSLTTRRVQDRWWC